MLQIPNTKGNKTFFDANNWSCFPNEDERLFLSPRSVMTISNIHDIVRGKQFKVFVKVINVLRDLTGGFLTIPAKKPTSKTPFVLSKLIDNELAESFLNVPYKSDVPYYVSCLFHRYLHCGTEVMINHYNMEQHEAYHDGRRQLYGFKLFQSIFKYPDCSMYNLCLFFRLFPNLEKMVVFNYVKNEWKESIAINGVFLEEILKQCCIKLVAQLRVVSTPRCNCAEV